MIKILKDVCVLQPQFPKTSEICVKIMRRISDEEGIKVHISLNYLPIMRSQYVSHPATGE